VIWGLLRTRINTLTIITEGVIQPMGRDDQHTAKDRDTHFGNVARKSVTLKCRKEDASQGAGHQANDAPLAMKAEAPHQCNRAEKGDKDG